MTFKSNDLLHSRCESVDYRYIVHSDVMATKGYSFQDDGKTTIDIDIDMDIATTLL